MLKAQVRKLANQAAAGRLTFDGNGLVGAVTQAAQSEWAEGSSRGESAHRAARAPRARHASSP